MSDNEKIFNDEYAALIETMTDRETSGCQPEGVLFEFISGFIDFARREHGAGDEKTANSYAPEFTINVIRAAIDSVSEQIKDGEF